MIKNKLILAISTLTGTIIGVGIFGLPFVFYKAGFALGVFYLIALTIIITLIHLIWGEVSSETEENHRLVGYAHIYLGRKAKAIATIVTIFGFFGSLIAYLLLGSRFLAGSLNFLLGSDLTVYIFIVWLISSWAIIKGIRMVATMEFIINLFLIGIIILFFAIGLEKLSFNKLTFANWDYFFLPYGVILFSLAGGSAIPELREIVASKKDIKKAIIIGTFIPALLYLAFVIGIFGINGGDITEDALSGIANSLGEKFAIAGQIFGFLATITSFFIIGLYLKKTFLYDYNISKIKSSLLVILIPLSFVLMFQNLSFIKILEIIGIFSIGIEGIILILIYKKIKLKKGYTEFINLPNSISYFLIAVFIGAIIYYFIH